MEWWEEPQIAEPEWEAVDRKAKAKQQQQPTVTEKKAGGGMSRDNRPVIAPPRNRDGGLRGKDGGRGMSRGGDRGGRGASRGVGDRRSSGGGGGMSQKTNTASSAPSPSVPTATSTPALSVPKQESGVPTPVTNTPVLKGAWGQKAFSAVASSTPAAPAHAPAAAAAPVVEPIPVEMPPTALEPEEVVAPEVDLGVNMMTTSDDPTPSGLTPAPVAPTSAGNVWATRGSAHLIQAEKPKPPAPAPLSVQEVVPEYEEPAVIVEEEPLPLDEPLPEPDLMSEPAPLESFMGVGSALPPSVNGANINASGWEPILEPSESMSQPSVEIPQPSPVAPPPMSEPITVEEPMTLPEPISAAAAPVAPVGVKPSNVLNMGHWETGDADDDDLDFGFGSFAAGNDNEEVVSAAPPAAESVPLASTNTSHASPARPPPGLSMPPMPAGAMLVHELENKLESTALGQNEDTSTSKNLPEQKDLGQSNQSSQPQPFNTGNDLGGQSYPGQYGGGGYGMGMYNMGTSNNGGFGSMPPGQFPLGGPINQQQQPKPQQSGLGGSQGPRPTSSPQTLQQVGPYGMQNPGGNDASGASNNDAPSNMPPGMPGGMQYPNPAFMYGQYNQVMGHPAYGGMQYGGYGQQQFGGPYQGHQYGNNYQGQNYGGGPYDGGDQGGPQHHGNTRDNYQKGGGGGGYRGRNHNNHHNQNQYGGGNNYHSGNQYGGGNNYQGQGGYVGGPYGGNMGYGGGPDQSHYQNQGGYENDHKGKKGPNNRFQQQPLGLQGSSNDGGNSGGWGGSQQNNWGGNWQQES